MALTSQQRRQLDELAGELARDNPRLARALAGRWYTLRRRCNAPTPRTHRRGRVRDWLTISLLLAAVPLLTVGVILAQPMLILIGAAAMLNGPVLFALAHRPP